MRLDSRIVRALVAIAGAAVVAAGILRGSESLVATGATMLGWALPWAREITLDRECKRALWEMEQGHPREAQQRLRRASQAPPTTEGQG